MVATAGHVDHGKSALVEALTGRHPSRLPEEKARGITIDLGFGCWEVAHPGEPGVWMEVGMVDVPGHEDFVKNMVAGMGAIEVALLVVAADDGWMPQTEEHVQILEYLGVHQAVVALTKADLVGTTAAAEGSVRSHLERSALAGAPVIPLSVVTGQGVEALKGALAEVLGKLASAACYGKPRLWVDRALSLRGVGTVVTGTLEGGRLRVGDGVVLGPSGAAGRIRSIQSHRSGLGEVGPGCRVALGVPEWAVWERGEGSRPTGGVRRGDVVTRPEEAGASDTWEVELERCGRGVSGFGGEGEGGRGRHGAGRELRNGVRVWVHHGTAHHEARVVLMGPAGLGVGAKGLAQLRFDTAVSAFVGDRFVVRDGAARTTLAGGVVLSPVGRRRGAREAGRVDSLRRRAEGMGDIRVLVGTELGLAGGMVARQGLLARSRISEAAVEEGVAGLAAEGAVVVQGPWLVEPGRWRGWLEAARAAVESAHREHPERVGLELSRLRAELAEVSAREEVFEALVGALGGMGYGRQGEWVRRLAHRPALPVALQGAGERLRAALGERPLDPPGRRDLVAGAGEREALRFLVETGQVVELGEEVMLLAEHYRRAVLLVKGHLRRQGRATVGELRQALGTTRRVMVPLLERLDREGVTVREGDWRRLAGLAKAEGGR